MIPKISVIIPVFNVENYLRQCLDSVVNQTLKEIEIILIDDGSTDSSLFICQEYAQNDDRIHLIQQKNKGAGATRNQGIKFAKGEYIAFLDADDWWELNALEYLHTKAKIAKVDIILFDVLAFDEKTPESKSTFGKIFESYILPEGTFSVQNLPDTGSKLIRGACWFGMYKRDFILSENCYFDESVPNTEDAIFSIKTILYASKIFYVHKFLLYHRVNRKNSLTYLRKETWKSPFIAYSGIKDIFEKEGTYKRFERVILNRFIQTLYFQYMQTPEPIPMFLAQKTVKETIPYFQLDKYGLSYFYSKNLYNFVLRIKQKNNYSEKLETLFYSDKSEIIPIVFSADERTSWCTMVTVQSIMEHADSNRFYDIYLLHTDIPEGIQERFEELSKANIRLTCIDVKSKLPKDISFCGKEGKTWYPFLIPNLFYGYDKIIYLDSKIILKTDVAELLAMNMEEKAIAGFPVLLTKDLQKYIQKKIKLNPSSYVNLGVLVFNISKWQEHNLTEQIWQKGNTSYSMTAQDMLNIVCKNEICLLPSEWCYQVSSDSKDENFRASKLLYYTSGNEPWLRRESKYSKIWWSYARKSSFYEVILFQG